MKYISLLTFSIFFTLTSCKKNVTEPIIPEDPLVYLMKLKDSCSFTIEGKMFKGSNINSISKGRAPIAIDHAANKFSTDSTLYFTMFQFSENEIGNFKIAFMKKYSKNQLTKSVFLGINGPESELVLYKNGEHKYAIDFETFNTENGISIEVWNPKTSSEYELLTSSVPFWKLYTTTLTPASHSNSKFEISKLQKLPNGKYFLEAKFTTNLFDSEERLKRLEDGYLRMQISIVTNDIL